MAIASLVMRNKEYLVSVRPAPKEGVLVLQTMYFADEVRSARGAPAFPGGGVLPDRELAIAGQLIDAMTAPFQAEQYSDTHRERVEELVASKHEGREIVLEAPPPAPKVVDLLAALEASVRAEAGIRGPCRAPEGTAPPRPARRPRAPNPKPAPKKAPKKAAPAKRPPAAKKTAPARQRKAS